MEVALNECDRKHETALSVVYIEMNSRRGVGPISEPTIRPLRGTENE